MSTHSKHRTGFTLIELIVTLILVGFVGALIVPFFYAGVFDSGTPVDRVANNRELQSVIENAMEGYFEGYYNASMPLDGSDPNNATYPMQAFIDYVEANTGDFNASGTLSKLELTYPWSVPGPSPYLSDNRVTRVYVEHETGASYVFFLGQYNQ